MKRNRAFVAVLACLMLGVFAASASAASTFQPRVRGAMGLIPPLNADSQYGREGLAFNPDIASGQPTDVTYHGGSVMTGGVTVHLVFWTGGTNPFPGSPQAGAPSYEGLLQQMYTDVAADSSGQTGRDCTSSDCNLFTVLPQYAQGTTPGGITKGSYSISYNTASDSQVDTDPYPDKSVQCASPDDAAVCITDGQVQTEIDNIAPANERGLHNLWFVFLPPGVDECINAGVCGTNAFGAYHSQFDRSANGVTIYAVGIDPVIEIGPLAPGQDPNGNPDAEAAADAAAHETVEAMTDPQGVGWMDPNGFEVADKCEFGPQVGTPLGNAGPDNAEYNQVINGDKYLIQEMWSNDQSECVQATTQTSNPLPLPQVNLSQFSSTVTGNTESGTGGTTVTVSLIRNQGTPADPSTGSLGNPVTVAQGTTTSAADGSWSVSLAPHAVGDDRDEIDIDYSGPGAPSPSHQVILTGNGGNPFTESGWTGWTDLDNGYYLTNSPPSLTVGPCFQTGVLSAFENGAPFGGTAESPTDFCNTQTDAATKPAAGPIGPGDTVTYASNDNRAFQGPDLGDIGDTVNQTGGLVSLSVQTGEPDSVSTFPLPVPPFLPNGVPSGFPTCSTDLQAQTVTCTGLVPAEGYTVRDSRSGESHGAAADDTGTVTVAFSTGGIHRGDQLALSNGSRTLTTLHVANLRVDITGEQTVLSGGSCSAGQYYAPPLGTAPTNSSAGDPTGFAGGAALSESICPLNGSAAGLSATNIVQTDELSGGSTTTNVPDVEDTSPMNGEIVYGNFVALAESGLPGPDNTVIPTDSTSKIAVSIAPAAGGAPVFTSSNVDTANGVPVSGLKTGSYRATWTLTDANGDTRTVTSRFIEEASATKVSAVKPKVSCTKADGGKKYRCKVTYPKINGKKPNGTVQMRLSRGGKTVGLGHGKVKSGKAKVTITVKKHVTHGKWTATLVLKQKGKASITSHVSVRMT